MENIDGIRARGEHNGVVAAGGLADLDEADFLDEFFTGSVVDHNLAGGEDLRGDGASVSGDFHRENGTDSDGAPEQGGLLAAGLAGEDRQAASYH